MERECAMERNRSRAVSASPCYQTYLFTMSRDLTKGKTPGNGLRQDLQEAVGDGGLRSFPGRQNVIKCRLF